MSRKKQVNQKITALYCRFLWRMAANESMSIESKNHLRDFAEKNGFPVCVLCGRRLPGRILLGLDSDTFYIYHVAAVMVDNLRRLLLGINLSDKAIMDFDFPGVGFPV